MRDGYDPNESQFRIGWLHDDEDVDYRTPEQKAKDEADRLAFYTEIAEGQGRILREMYEPAEPKAFNLETMCWEKTGTAGERACTRCTGTGTLTDVHAYGPASHFACFDCHGSGIAA